MSPAPAASGARTTAPLHDVPAALRDEPALAAALGLSQPSVSRRLRGEVPWDVAELAIVAGLVGVPVASFFGRAA